MDRNVVTGTILIFVIMMAWLWWLSPPPPAQPTMQEEPIQDTSAVVQEEEARAAPGSDVIPLVTDSLFAGAQQGEARQIVVKTDLYEAVLSTQGATLESFVLSQYTKFDQETPVHLVDTTTQGALSLVFTTPTNHVVDTRSLYFSANFDGDTLRVADQPAALTFTANVGEGFIRQTYTFQPGEYEVGLDIEQQNAASFQTSQGYELIWNGGIPFTEGDFENEALATGAFASSGGEVESVTLDSGDPYEEQRLAGDVAWTAVKNKYFTAVVIPSGETRGAELAGDQLEPFGENYVTRLMMPAPQAVDAFRLYLGPMEFYRITDYDLGLYGMVDYGWDAFEWITRPLAQFIFIPIFELLGSFIPNYGIVIIIFALLIKIVTYPLTKSSYTSMARMRELQPKMEAIKEKYGDDPQKQQEAMMRMYKETGINPLGGCLPMLLQYPVLIALWQFFPSAIELRQQSFLWANDLSAPDVILSLPFTIPLYGDFVAGFTLLMGLSMVAQMKLTMSPSMAANPQAKIFTYLMPVMLFVFFNRLAAGLSLYYLFFNVLSAVQQKFINKEIHDKGGEAAATNGKGSKKEAAKAKPVKRDKPEKSGKRLRT